MQLCFVANFFLISTCCNPLYNSIQTERRRYHYLSLLRTNQSLQLCTCARSRSKVHADRRSEKSYTIIIMPSLSNQQAVGMFLTWLCCLAYSRTHSIFHSSKILLATCLVQHFLHSNSPPPCLPLFSACSLLTFNPLLCSCTLPYSLMSSPC